MNTFIRNFSVVAVAALSSFAATSPAHAANTYTAFSGPKASGTFSRWSEWFETCAESPKGERIVSHKFYLRGDRACNAWAECVMTVSSSTRVCYHARLQGHNEWTESVLGPDQGSRNSEGVLVIQTE